MKPMLPHNLGSGDGGETLTTLEDSLAGLDAGHRVALSWFLDHAGQEVAWPKPLPSGQLVANKAKGIHKPAGWDYALSVRQSLGGPYDDKEVDVRPDGSWRFDYYQEGKDPTRRDDDYTNRALVRNMEAGVPVGVIVQAKKKPQPRYKVLGLARVTNWAGGYFRLEGFRPTGEVGEATEADGTDALIEALGSLPESLTDARKRINTAIVARQGAGAFRKAALTAFKGRCAVTGCDVPDVLEAAHIVPYLGKQTNIVTNTLLLRADIHTLFDRGLLSVSADTLKVEVAEGLRGSAYGELHGQAVKLPAGDDSGWRSALAQRQQLGG